MPAAGRSSYPTAASRCLREARPTEMQRSTTQYILLRCVQRSVDFLFSDSQTAGNNNRGLRSLCSHNWLSKNRGGTTLSYASWKGLLSSHLENPCRHPPRSEEQSSRCTHLFDVCRCRPPQRSPTDCVWWKQYPMADVSAY